ncbi:telomere-protecting terminal protein Tpg [Streptomyces asiaticus]|uniref:telomere-protecting terminal protein Tpg n=1 Tax=Streptomyces asiaticus TaxID=114695 RepID=UPI003821B66D
MQKLGRQWAGDAGELTLRTVGAGPADWPLGEADVGQIEQGLERALRTRPIPSSTEARLRFLLATHRGSTRKVATVLGVSQRTVQRWVTRRSGARRPPGPLQVRAIEEAVLARWQPRVRARRRAQAEAEGFVFHTRARFGFAASAGSSDDPRVRWITQDLPREVARELFAARDAGADAGTRLLSRMGPPGPRSAYFFQRRRVRRLLDRMSLPLRAGRFRIFSVARA